MKGIGRKKHIILRTSAVGALILISILMYTHFGNIENLKNTFSFKSPNNEMKIQNNGYANYNYPINKTSNNQKNNTNSYFEKINAEYGDKVGVILKRIAGNINFKNFIFKIFNENGIISTDDFLYNQISLLYRIFELLEELPDVKLIQYYLQYLELNNYKNIKSRNQLITLISNFNKATYRIKTEYEIEELPGKIQKVIRISDAVERLEGYYEIKKFILDKRFSGGYKPIDKVLYLNIYKNFCLKFRSACVYMYFNKDMSILAVFLRDLKDKLYKIRDNVDDSDESIFYSLLNDLDQLVNLSFGQQSLPNLMEILKCFIEVNNKMSVLFGENYLKIFFTDKIIVFFNFIKNVKNLRDFVYKLFSS